MAQLTRRSLRAGTVKSIGTGVVLQLAILCMALGLLNACQKHASAIDREQYRREIEEWRKERLGRLMKEDGWLSLVGLFWLKEGENAIGSDSSNDVVLPPGKTLPVAGSILLRRGTALLRVRPGSSMMYDGSAVSSLALQSDEAGQPTVVRLGTVRFYMIKRGDRYAVRVSDSESAARRNFQGLEYFPINPAWRVVARFEPYVPPTVIEIMTQVGTVEKVTRLGALSFEIDGKAFRLDAVMEKGSEDQLFIMLADKTNGEETYAVGRQLYTSLPDSSNTVILDFNKAYNWPCVFTDFATCPIPPPQNRLPMRVEAGEKMYGGHK